MRIERWIPSAVAVALALGLFTANPSPARAQNETEDEEAAPKVEKRVIRVEDGDENDSDAKAGYLGVQVQALTPSLRRAKSLPGSVEGALINGVEEGSPAGQAGIRKGDIVLEVDQTGTPDPGKLIDVVRDLKPGAKAKVVVWRDGNRKTFYVVVGSRPDEGFEIQIPREWGGHDPEALRWHSDTLQRHHVDLERQLADIQDEIAKLRREIRELRSELRTGTGRDRD